MFDPQKVKRINDISPCFCVAKWTQVTIDLLHGTNHSCHHPKRHNIDPDEVRKNPAALHNTPFKKQVRGQMLRGERPEECSYCWNIEDTPGEHFSDRMVKSLDPWSYPHVEEVLEVGDQGDIAPRYLEVMFDNACNFACGYCLADISSSIKNEMQKHGPYPIKLKDHRMPDPKWQGAGHGENNPFIEAFWKWLPDIWNKLQVFRITGGEPLLSKHTYQVLDYCLKNPQPQLQLAVNSNLGVDRKRLDRFLELLEEMAEKKVIHSFHLYVSVDAVGKQAEYIRQGLNYDTFIHHLQIFLESKACSKVTLMNTFNILSLPTVHKLVAEVAALKKKYPHLVMDTSYLKEPQYLRANIVEGPLLENVKEATIIMQESGVFTSFEMNKMQRIYHWLKTSQEKIEKEKQAGGHEERVERTFLRSEFYGFIGEYDKRYDHKFLDIFPELRDFYVSCKKARFLNAVSWK